MNFISQFLQNINDPRQLLMCINEVVEDPSIVFTRLTQILPNKRSRFNQYKDLIRLHMPAILQKEFKASNFLPRSESNNWDSYVKSINNVMAENAPESFVSLVDAANALSVDIEKKPPILEKFDALKKQFANLLEITIIHGGLATSFQNIYGLLRVIPILAQESSDKLIDKAKLITCITSKTTQRFLKKIMVLNSHTMNALVNILWQKPVADIDDARDKFRAFDDTTDLASLSLHSANTMLYHPDNFELKDDGIDFNRSGEYYYKAAAELVQEERTGGCPAIAVDDLQTEGKFDSGDATEVVCKLVGQIINLIPDERFNELIKAPRTNYETIRLNIKNDFERMQKGKNVRSAV